MSPTRLQRGVRAALLGLGANMVLASAKLAAGIIGHSHALTADAVESFADVFSSLVVWRGLVLAAEPADEDHPYGHGKAEPIAAAVVALMLIAAAAGIASKSGFEIRSPKMGPKPFTLGVLVAVVAIKESLFRFLSREAGALSSSVIRSDAWHHRSDAITSLAAALGISAALLGGPGFAIADDIAALIAAVIIAWNGWTLLRPALSELMDKTPDVRLTDQVRQTARAISGVEGVEKCLVRKMGCHFFIDMHLEVDPQMTVERAHQISHDVKDSIRRQFPAVSDVLVHIEPKRRSRDF